MASAKKIITVFGATGNQGGSVINIGLAHANLSSKYAFRGVTRDPSSAKSQALAAKGVELVKAELSDIASIKAAVKGSWGVFGVTDFWSLLDKEKEIQQGKNIFDACKETGVKHFVFASLPFVEKLSGGAITGVKHFDSKALVREYAEANKGSDLLVSYYDPAMFYSNLKTLVHTIEGTPTMSLPFPGENIDWPLHDPARDGGKFVMGLFEGGEKSNGVVANGVSAWTTPKQVVQELSKVSGKEVVFSTIPAKVFASFLPPAVSEEITDMMVWIGEHNYYGKEAKAKQAESDKWLVEPVTDLQTYVKDASPWSF
ncbi:NAD(P)-binding protein [Polychaeton citri CBS 116435]|uniref:NAD(P)-binding protein n=1 Tax=Polychaeton citri CBS 116435 TaxID=1314669 RepID=A0A9P4UK07_9PEZI|nr:NAD(P)-binding protein [Polychaeton citri CBS 116435]